MTINTTCEWRIHQGFWTTTCRILWCWFPINNEELTMLANKAPWDRTCQTTATPNTCSKARTSRTACSCTTKTVTSRTTCARRIIALNQLLLVKEEYSNSNNNITTRQKARNKLVRKRLLVSRIASGNRPRIERGMIRKTPFINLVLGRAIRTITIITSIIITRWRLCQLMEMGVVCRALQSHRIKTKGRCGSPLIRKVERPDRQRQRRNA